VKTSDKVIVRANWPCRVLTVVIAGVHTKIAAADFFVVPTITYRLMFVLVILNHQRRRVTHVAVTAHPTRRGPPNNSARRFPEETARRYLIHDRDHAFASLPATASGMGIEELSLAKGSPQPRPIAPPTLGPVIAIPQVGGLHYHYDRRAA
jgi:hypothetical protein